jgi:HlyD family secretion protein/adhesin transport system membrane fusion protein
MLNRGKSWAADPKRLTSPLEIEGERWNGMFRGFAIVLSLFIVSLVLLAAVSPINEVAISSGNIASAQPPSALQHQEGGVVEQLYAGAGAHVKKGDVIIQLREFQNERKQGQLDVRISDAELNIARLQALIDGTEPDFPDADPQLLTRQEISFFQERRAARKNRDVLLARVAQREAELSAADDQMESLQQEKSNHIALVEMQRNLAAEGYGSRQSLLRAESELAKTEGQIAQTRGQTETASKALLEAQASLAQLTAENKARWSAELTQITTELKDLQEQSRDQQDRNQRLAIRAPFDGWIQSLVPKAPGEVVRAGEPIGEIVPEGSPLYASVRLLPKDVGTVAIDDKAIVTLTAFNADNFGEVQGTVTKISPTTASDEQGNVYYEVDVALESVEGKRVADLSRLRPGMELQARIQTEKRTILRYFLRPVYRSLEVAFSES